MSPTIRRTIFVMLTFAVGLYAIMHLSGPNGLSALLEKRDAIGRMEKEIQDLENKVEAKAKYVEDIKAKKPEVVIPLIRRRTNWVRDGETDFRTETEKAPVHTPKP